MARKIYKRIGLQRQNNLSDLSDSKAALNNLLDDIASAGGISGQSFIGDDLNSIKNIYAQGLSNAEYRKIGGSATKYWDQSAGQEKIFEPKITYQNRLDQFKNFAGTPRLNGGDGLTASYFDYNQVLENTVGIFNGAPFKIDQFWEAGQFEWDRKLHPQSINANGGIQWEGYFIPSVSGYYTFTIQSSGCHTVDFQTNGYLEDDDGNIISTGISTYTELSRVGVASTASCSAHNFPTETNKIILDSADDVKHVAIGQSVSHAAISGSVLVDDFDRDSRVITLTLPDSGNSITSNFSNENIIFSTYVGQSTKVIHTTSYSLEEFKRYRIRLRYFIPQLWDSSGVNRYMNVLYARSGTAAHNLRYNKLYSLNYDFSESQKGDFNKYLDNSVRFGGTGQLSSSGIGSVTDYLKYVKIKSNNKIDIKYDPRNKTQSDCEKATKSLSVTNGTNIIPTGDTSNLEVGQYAYDSTNTAQGATRAIPDGTRINQIVPNSTIILDRNCVASQTINVTFVDQRGHVQRFVGQSDSGDGNTTIQLNTDYNVNNLKKGMLVIGGNIVNNTKIDSTDSGTRTIGISTNKSGNINSDQVFYVYQSQGLLNESLNAFCTPSQTKCVTARLEAAAGSTTLHVEDATHLNGNERLVGYYFQDDTFITAKSTNSIIINKSTSRLIKVGNNWTATNETYDQAAAEAGGDRGLCCPPKDTSPPFEATDAGMQTTSDYQNMHLVDGDVKFDEFGATNITTFEATDYSTFGQEGVKTRMRIHTPSGIFRIITT